MHEENGDYMTYSFSIDQFPGLSVQQVHDRIMYMYTSHGGVDARLDVRQVRTSPHTHTPFFARPTDLWAGYY